MTENKTGEIVIFKTADDKVSIDVHFEGETVWLTIDDMASLFEKSRSTINEHILNIFEEGELEKENVVRKIGNSDFSTKPTNYYNLDVIISVGYRVKSLRGTQFRQWATKRLNEYIRKGFTMDDERLKEAGGGDYWKELLARIRDIRSSEKVMYRQVLDLYATSADYNPKSAESVAFFKMVQNKLHYAVSKQTAAEIIYDRADCEKDFMGLTSFKGADVTLDDVRIAKNYAGHVNLIPVNPIKERYYRRGSRQDILAFKNKLEKNGINVTIRREMGRDIDGACGQLRRRVLNNAEE